MSVADAQVLLPELLKWTDAFTAEDGAKLPAAPAVCLFEDATQRPVQLLTTQHLRRLVTTRLSTPEEPVRGRTNLAEVVRGVRYRMVYCPFEARWHFLQLARALYPQRYRKLVGFGPAWFLNVDWAAPIPAIDVTQQVWCAAGEFIGPWPTHKAGHDALTLLWDLFDLCRYPEQVHRAPRGTRCAYAEMGRCDAPCDGSVPLAAYVARCRAAWAFASSGQAAWIAQAEQAMRAAAAAQAFERAGQIKQQVASAQRWQRQWGAAVGPLPQQLERFMLLPATRRRAWKAFGVRHGAVVDGPLISPRRLDALRDWLSAASAGAAPELPPIARMEETWLVCHLLAHREGQAAIVWSWPHTEAAEDWAALRDHVRDEIAARTTKRAAAASDAEAEAGPELTAGDDTASEGEG